MKAIAAAMVAVFLVLPGNALAQAGADDPVELVEARAIIAIMFPPDERERTFATMVQQVLSQFRQGMPEEARRDPGVAAILDRYLDGVPDRLAPLINAHLPKILDATAIAYTHEFSLQELQEIHAFAQTPSGQHYLKASSKMIGDPAVAAANTAYLTELQREQQSLQQELVEELSAYSREHRAPTTKMR